MVSHEKTNHLLADPLTPVTDAWTLKDNNLLHQVLTTMELKVQDVVLHCVTVKELWCFLSTEKAAISTGL